MSIGIWQLIIILAIVIILFGGGGKISSILKDLGKGLKTFKKEVSNDNQEDDNATSLKLNDNKEQKTKKQIKSSKTKKKKSD